MKAGLKSVIKAITPPIVWRGAKAVFVRGRDYHRLNDTGQKGPDFYDATFEESDSWRRHYSESHYYFLWTVLADRIARAGVESILEIGCGSGQLACLLRDKGVSRYHGFDFSARRIEQARKVCPTFTFSVQDAFQTELFTTNDYKAVVCTEFLEHVEGDLEVLGKIRPGTRFYGTVPNFPFVSHVRHFGDKREVHFRYDERFSDLRVDTFLANARGKTFYLLEGTKR